MTPEQHLWHTVYAAVLASLAGLNVQRGSPWTALRERAENEANEAVRRAGPMAWPPANA